MLGSDGTILYSNCCSDINVHVFKLIGLFFKKSILLCIYFLNNKKKERKNWDTVQFYNQETYAPVNVTYSSIILKNPRHRCWFFNSIRLSLIDSKILFICWASPFALLSGNMQFCIESEKVSSAEAWHPSGALEGHQFQTMVCVPSGYVLGHSRVCKK